MNYPEEWTQDQIDKFYEWISEQPAFRGQVAEECEIAPDELEHRGLRPEDAAKLVKFLKWLRVLPYADQRIGRDILVFYYSEFRRISRTLQGDARGQRLCSLFPALARMMFQGVSIFPGNAGGLATALMHCLQHYQEHPDRANVFEALADLIVDPDNERFLHGYNAEELNRNQVNALIKSEHLRLAGNFESMYRTKQKYAGYQERLRENGQFQHDWQILRQRFPSEFTPGKIVLHTNRPESRLPTTSHSPTFNDVFDFFCWKWFLDGMKGDDPIVAKLSFDVTPFGTTIFIPGYWNFDRKRDLKWKELLEFHRSRGVKRQGEKFEPMRRRREFKVRKCLEAEAISKAKNESDDAFIWRCIEMAKLPEEVERTYIQALLAEGRRNQRRGQPSAQQQALPFQESQDVSVPGISRIRATTKETARNDRRSKTR